MTRERPQCPECNAAGAAIEGTGLWECGTCGNLFEPLLWEEVSIKVMKTIDYALWAIQVGLLLIIVVAIILIESEAWVQYFRLCSIGATGAMVVWYFRMWWKMRRLNHFVRGGRLGKYVSTNFTVSKPMSATHWRALGIVTLMASGRASTERRGARVKVKVDRYELRSTVKSLRAGIKRF